MLNNWTIHVRRWLFGIAGLILVGSIIVWFTSRDTLPRKILISAGQSGGTYYHYATALAQALESRGRSVEVEVTRGSGENCERLRANHSNLGIIQAGSVSLDGLAVIAPLTPEIVHVIVRTDSNITSLAHLRGKRIALGLPDSGMRSSALQILSHYRLKESDFQAANVYFREILNDSRIDAAIATTGIENPELKELLATRKFRLLPIEDAAALELKFPHFHTFQIPKGLYDEDPSVPKSRLPTVATTSYLVCRTNTSQSLVTEMLNVLYDDNLQESLTGLIPRHKVLENTKLRWHPVARAYFDPFDQLGFTANVMESLAAVKELLVALGAAIFLCWDRWHRWRQAQKQSEMQKLKDRLDEFLTQTIEIERQFLESTSPSRLQELLDEVSLVKLQALQELTHEDLRGDRMFSIFLLQCGNLSQALQGKLWLARIADRYPA